MMDPMAPADRAPGQTATFSPVCPFSVGRPVMQQRWERLTFLHWAYEPAVVQRLLPSGLVVDSYAGAAWVGLIPFFMRVRTASGHGVPWVSNFCETNVRTYVRDHEGRAGIWFLSLDAARLGAVAVARASYRLPYFWSAMRLARRGREMAYFCHRRRPGSGGPASAVRVRIGDPCPAAGLTGRDHFLTARWVLFSQWYGRPVFARAAHRPWPLYRAEALAVQDGLITAAGLPAPEGPPLAHYSPGVDVRIGRPQGYRLAAGRLYCVTAGRRPRSSPPGPGRSTSARRSAPPAGPASRSSTPRPDGPGRPPQPTSRPPGP
jgi:uncharacterized protein